LVGEFVGINKQFVFEVLLKEFLIDFPNFVHFFHDFGVGFDWPEEELT
jgi:hypothetical protein